MTQNLCNRIGDWTVYAYSEVISELVAHISSRFTSDVKGVHALEKHRVYIYLFFILQSNILHALGESYNPSSSACSI
jgi:hypothetical protein